MKHKSFNVDIACAVLCVALTLKAEFATGKPLDPEDVESLLPATPQTKNETVAAIVQDPVVKNAVQYAVKNGSLSGLVVKKNVVIIPASAPDQVLSQRQQVLVAPVTHLEDIRKNITEGQQAEDDAEDIDEFQPSSIVYQNEWTTNDEMGYEISIEENESTSPGPKTIVFHGEVPDPSNDPKNLSINAIVPQVKPAVELPEGAVTQKIDLSGLVSNDTVSVPVVAVLDPSKAADKKVESSIVALLPNDMKGDDLKSGLNYLEKNRAGIEKDVRKFVDQSTMTIEATSWKTSTPAESLSRKNEKPVTRSNFFAVSYVQPEETKMYVAPGVLSRAVETDDMDTAQDIVFRPLFRFRQEAQRRANYQAAESYRRSSYRQRPSYDSDSYYDSYRRPSYRYRPRYYNDDDDY